MTGVVWGATCVMTDWNALHTLLAVVSTGSYADAARKLGIDETTVSRRVRSLERDIGRRLLERGGRHLETTQVCRDVLSNLKDAERSIDLTLDKLAAPQDPRPIQTIRITSVDYICDQLLAPMVHLLTEERNFRIELVGDDRNLSLRRREADVALRLGPPMGGGTHSRFIADIEYSVYSAIAAKTRPEAWAALDIGQAHLQEVKWSETAGGDAGVRFTATSIAGLQKIIGSGIAIGFLPRFMADQDKLLHRLDTHETKSRSLWMLWHPEFEQAPYFTTITERMAAGLQQRLLPD